MADTFITNVVQHQHDNDTNVLYGCLRNPAGQIRDIVNGAWITHPVNGESLGDCDISASLPTGYMWRGSFPVEVDDGFYIYQIRKQASAEANYADMVVGAVKGYWDGTILSEENQTLAVIGIPANIDSGGATIADNLKKLADDNGGADFDATTDSLGVVAYRVGNIVANVTEIKAQTDQIDFTNNNPSTGKGEVISTLSSTGLDSISTGEPSGRATTFREMLIQLYMRFFNKAIKNTTTITTYDTDGTSVTEQSYTSSGGVDTVNKATDA